MSDWIFQPPPVVGVEIAGTDARFPVRRIFCVGRNYAAHAREMGQAVAYPPETSNFHYEIELVVAIGKEGFDIPVEQARDYIFGYTVGNDLTRRDLQLEAREKGRPWDWGKAFDDSAVISPLRRVEEVGHPDHGRIWLAVNGETKQDQDIADLIWSVPEIVSILSRSMRIKPGDLIYTGTPAGVGPIKIGDQVTGGIDGLGTHAIEIVAP
jgi:fumarylpyruvate hydrolase